MRAALTRAHWALRALLVVAVVELVVVVVFAVGCAPTPECGKNGVVCIPIGTAEGCSDEDLATGRCVKGCCWGDKCSIDEETCIKRRPSECGDGSCPIDYSCFGDTCYPPYAHDPQLEPWMPWAPPS